MLKALLYIGLSMVGIVATLLSPFAGTIACIEAYLMNPSALAMNDGGFRYQFLINVAFLLSILIHRPRGAARVGRESWIMIALWIFIAIGTASAAWALVSPETSLDAIYELFKTVLFCTLMISTITTEKQMRIVVVACIFGVFHAAVLHVFGTRFGYVDPSLGREVGVLSDPQTAVDLLFIPVMMLLATLGGRTERILSWVALPVVLDSVVNSYQRAGFVGLGAELVLILLFIPMRLKLRLLPVLAAGLALFVFRLTPDNYWKWMTTIETPEQEASAASRFEVGHASWAMLADYPFGVGYRNYPVVSPRYLPPEALTEGQRAPHNNYFAIACETGIEGFIPWALMLGGALWMLRRIRKGSDPRNLQPLEVYAMGFEIGLYGWMVMGLFHDCYETDPAYWFVALSIVLTRLSFGDSGSDGDDAALHEPQAVAELPLGGERYLHPRNSSEIG